MLPDFKFLALPIAFLQIVIQPIYPEKSKLNDACFANLRSDFEWSFFHYLQIVVQSI